MIPPWSKQNYIWYTFGVKTRLELKKFLISILYKLENVKSWYCKNNYSTDLKCSIIDVWQGFLICLWYSICQDSEYAKILQGSEYAYIIPEYVWLCLNMPTYAGMREYAKICLDGFLLAIGWIIFGHRDPLSTRTCGYLLYYVIYYVWTKLEVIVWKSVRLFSWQDKIWFSLE